MIESILLHNFQKHRKLRIEFDEHVTIIMGRSDIGKSSIIRALRWVCLNKGPKRVHRHGTDSTSVTLFVDGHKLTRRKSSKVNMYSIDGEEYKALKKSGMPDQVAALLELDEINFQRQLDSHYWFSLSPAQISAELNRIVNMAGIDESVSHVAARVRKSKSRLEVSDERIQELTLEKSRLKWIKAFDQELADIERLQKHVDEMAEKSAHLALVIEKAVRLRKALPNATMAASDRALLLKTYTAYQTEQAAAAERIERLERIIEGLQLWEQRIQRNERSLTSVKAELKKIGDRCPTCGTLLVK